MLFKAGAFIFFWIRYVGDRNIYFLHSGLIGFYNIHVTCIQRWRVVSSFHEYLRNWA